LRSLKERRRFWSDIAGLQTGAWTMGPFVLEALFRVFGIRGHLPRYDGLPERPARSSLTNKSIPVTRILLIIATVVAALLVVLWVAVWLAIKSL
jgi:hypothetical protein